MANHGITLDLIIPAYNEAGRIRCAEMKAFLLAHPEIHFWFMEDRSDDGTLGELNRFAADPALAGRITVRENRVNLGKSGAVRQGMLLAMQERDADILGFFDADLATPLDQFPLMLELFQKERNLEALLGSRVKRLGAKIDRKLSRHLIGRIIATWISNYLDLPVYDSQCGAKMFRRPLAEAVFREPFVSRWLFDVELLRRMTEQHSRDWVLDHVQEYPLRAWHDIRGSKLSMADAPAIIGEMLKIQRHYH